MIFGGAGWGGKGEEDLQGYREDHASMEMCHLDLFSRLASQPQIV